MLEINTLKCYLQTIIFPTCDHFVVAFFCSQIICLVVKLELGSIQCVTHELSGEIGEVAKRLITSLKEIRYKSATLEGYERVLSYFIIHLSGNSIYDPSEISEKEILSFISSTQNCKPGTLIVMRSFCRYLYEQKIIGHDIGYVIGKDSRPVQERLPSVYDAKEIKQIEDTVD